MCGIIGYLTSRSGGLTGEERSAFATRTARLGHRGPDNASVAQVGDGVLLGHTRLSIIDLSSDNNQPFAVGPCVLCFNGEIFNYRSLREDLIRAGYAFETAGDSEVIVAGYLTWGDAIFAKLKGMYAIALFDRRDETLHLARDAFGIKPLYYRERNGTLSFGSEIKALGGGLRLDPDGFADLITLGYHFGQGSLYEGVHSVEQGHRHSYRIDGSELRLARHADKPLHEIAARPPAERRLEECLRLSVADHMIADVPVASTLSGGLDSSIVTALAKGRDADVTAYTNTLWPEGDAETRHAAILAERLGIAHRVLYSRIDDLHDLVDRIAWHVEEPLVNSAVFNSYHLAAQLRSDGYKVALVGEGSDELFAGYPWHALPLSEIDDAAMFERLRERRTIVSGSPGYLTPAARAAIAARRDGQTRIFLDEMAIDVGPRFNRFLLFDTRHQLVTMQLHRIDRLFMAHGIEARVPFLYDDVIQWAFHADPRARLDLSEPAGDRLRSDKSCLAEAFRDRLPREILTRPKFGKGGSANLGVTPPMAQWPSVFERVRTDDRYAEARDAVSGFIDWTAFGTVKTDRKEQMFLSMLVMSVCNLLAPESRLH